MLTSLIVGAAVGWSYPWITVPVETPVSPAKWIWVEGATASGGSTGTFWFRKSLEFVAAPDDAQLEVAADNHAEVWVNGKPVAKSSDWSRWTQASLKGAFKRGRNTILVKATNDVGTGVNPGGFILKADPFVHSDGSWECARDEAFTQRVGVSEIGGEDAQPWNLGTANVTPPLIRKGFHLDSAPKTAHLMIAGLGDYRLHVNAREVTQDLLLQPWSQYDKRLYFRTYDLTKFLVKGNNVVALMMGNSFWFVANPGGNRYHKGDAMPQFGKDRPFLVSAALEIDRLPVIVTDSSWKYHDGPITFSHVQAGEDYDERLIPKNWDRPGKLDDNWERCVPAKAPEAQVSSTVVRINDPSYCPPIEVGGQTPERNSLAPEAGERICPECGLETDLHQALAAHDETKYIPFPGVQVHERFRVQKWIERSPGRWSMDFGQNCSGILEFTVQGKSGQKLTLRPSEVMTPEGEVQQLNLWGQSAHCDFTLGSSAKTTHRWKFWYHGFRYAEVVGAVPAGKPNPKALPVIHKIELLHIRAANPTSGKFKSSSDLLNRTHDLIDWAMRSNMVHVLSDCPHREKMGWQECAYLLARCFSYRYDCEDWIFKLEQDTRDAQQPDGLAPTVAPTYLMLPFSSPYAFTVEWGAAAVLLPWHDYEWYGESTTLWNNYPSMRAFVDYVERRSVNHIAPSGLGDWYDYGHGHGPGPSRFTPTDLTATATQALCVDAVRKAAERLGNTEDEQKYAELWQEIRAAFLAKFYDPIKKVTANTGSPQAGCSMALYAGLIPEEDREAVLQNVLKDLEARNYQQTPGDVGHLYFVRTLAEMGRSDVLHKVYSRTGLGSYGGILAKGLTALPETWDAITVGSNSLNHCMLGHAFEWLYSHVLGVRQVPGGIGWKEVVIDPQPGSLSYCEGEVLLPQGKLIVKWVRKGDEIEITAIIPRGVVVVGTSADGQRYEIQPGRRKWRKPTRA